jgi:dihydrofolate reductase
MPTSQRPKISAIVAMSENRVIGDDIHLPWHLPADLKHFKTITSGHPILMGRKTYESIGRPLPNRTNIIITRNHAFKAEGCTVIQSIDQAIENAAATNCDEMFIIGGAEVYKQLMPHIQRIYLTIVHEIFEGDVFFPELNLAEWKETSRVKHDADDDNDYEYSFITLERV